MPISAVYRGYTIAKKLYQYGKPVVTGDSFISKFPPGFRPYVKQLTKASEIAFTGGLVSDILKGLDDGVDEDAPVQPKSSYGKYKKTRNRYTGRTRSRNSKFCAACYRRGCSCPSKPRRGYGRF